MSVHWGSILAHVLMHAESDVPHSYFHIQARRSRPRKRRALATV